MNYDLILIRYGELSLKSNYVRKYFETILVRNIKKALIAENISHRIRSERGRIYLITNNISKSLTILPRIFGIVSFSPAIQTTSAMEDVSSYALQFTKNILTRGKSFAIRPTRVGTHEYTSQEVAIRIGKDIVDTTKARVDLTHPNIELFIEIRNKTSFLFTKKIRGAGGLPLGTQGKILTFVERPSSLLAAWYLMRRGCNVVIASFNQLNEKIIRSFLNQWYADEEIIFINPTTEDFYQQVSRISTEKRCDAIATGHTLDEFNQSLSAIYQLKKNSNLPILSPLIAMTSQEIDQRCKIRGIPI